MQVHKKDILLLILMALMFIPLQAEDKDYTKGFIITLDGDTIEGWVKDRSSGTFPELYKRIRFKTGSSLLRKKYGPDQILAYSRNGQLYASLPLYEETAFFAFRYYLSDSYEYVFLRVIARDEPLTYYHWEYMDADNNCLDYIPLFYLDGSNQMVRVTQGVLGLKRKRLIEYFHDCYKLQDAIYQKRLNKIDEVYNFYLSHCVNP